MSVEREVRPAPDTVADMWTNIGGPVSDLSALCLGGRDPALPSVFGVTTAATASIAAATLGAAGLLADRNREAVRQVRVDALHAVVAFRSERHVRVLGGGLGDLWDPLAGDYRTADGWIRLHTNYQHHRAAALRVLGVPAERAAIASAVAQRSAQELETAVMAAGGVAAALRSREEWRAHPHGGRIADCPLVTIEPGAACPPVRLCEAERPLGGVRVLDLTRVIAGPVATRFLAAYGADVLRVEPPGFDEIPTVAVDGGFGKCSTVLDLRRPEGRSDFERLVSAADVVVHGYRPGALSGLGYSAARLAALRPGLIVGRLSAYGPAGPWAQRRGFDSLVQMVSGIADEGRRAAGEERPVPLPCQALDHATGYLLACGVLIGLRRRQCEGKSWRVAVSLAGTARWLDDLGRVDGGLDVPEPAPLEVQEYLRVDTTPWGRVEHVSCPGTIDGAPPRWDQPSPLAGSHPPSFSVST
jgi:crotonobetainyl-CoA:carnitine CoA-transferase CaiB-like acyl-CoA transferase